MRDNVRDKPIPIRADTDDGNQIKDSQQSTVSPLRARFAEDSAINEEEINEKNNSKHVLRQTSSNTSQTNTSIVLPKKKDLNNQKSNNTIPSSVEFKTSTIRQHYYPEGGWGWVVVICVMLAYIIQYGLQLSYGIFLCHLIKQPFGSDKYMAGIWLGSLSLGLSYFISPVLVSWCRRKSSRLTAIAGGLMASLGCLFASFASQFHQVFLSYGIFMSLGIGIARESANLMVGQYFKRRRHFVEIFVQSSIGIGITFMAPFLDWSIGTFRHWRAGLQLITCALFATFLIAVLYRPASLYHPQRRAILHLKTQRRKIREKNPQTKKPPFFDLSPLKSRSLQVILVSTFLFSFGHLSPLFYLTSIVREVPEITDTNKTVSDVLAVKPVISVSVLILHIIFGISLSIGVIIFGYLTVNRQFNCRIHKHYLCEISMFLTVLSVMAAVYLNHNYYNSVVFVIIYGISIGSFNYTNKILVFSLMRAKNFGKSWSYVQFVQCISIFLGIPIAGHINDWLSPSPYNYGFVFSGVVCLLGTLVLLVINQDFKNITYNLSDKFIDCHHHSCNASSDAHNPNAMNPLNAAINYCRSSDSGVQSQNEHNLCCNCGQRLLSIDETEPFKDYQSCKADDLRSQSMKAIDILDDDEDDEDFINLKLQSAPELQTFFCDDLYNYYHQNGSEEAMALFDPSRDKIYVSNDIDCLNSKKKLNPICDTTEENKPTKGCLRRTIETVAEESSSLN